MPKWKLMKVAPAQAPTPAPTLAPAPAASTPPPIPTQIPTISNAISWVDILPNSTCLQTCKAQAGPGQSVTPIESFTGGNETALCKVGSQIGSDSAQLGGCLVGEPCGVRTSGYQCGCEGDIGQYEITYGTAYACSKGSTLADFEGKRVCNHLPIAADSDPLSQYPVYYLCTVSPGSTKCDYTYLNKDGVCSKNSADTQKGLMALTLCVCVGKLRVPT